ncbi:hypothetical protein [Streptomyces sp. NRRL WC-3549]|uniref:hypothetical protein n=1 Tax=Streptomyces sp. NRRL WC-3549 TaxID=1463925 RepID=UPI0004CB5E4F|nr:hypothetical protein [Streptomyces sp. NRRL WC-3549]
MMRRRIRFAAVLAVVVLALTGFQTAGHGGKSGGKSRSGKSSGSSGGGCSNSKKSNGGYHDYSDNHYDDRSSGSTSGSTASTPTAAEAPEVRVVSCAQPKKGKRRAVTSSRVEIRSTASASHLYEVDVTFVDGKGLTVDTGEATVDLDAAETKTVTVRMDSPRSVSRVKRCLVSAEPQA